MEQLDMEQQNRETLDKETFVMWMERIMERFDKQDSKIEIEIPERPMMDGVPLLDNQDVCQMLHITKRTLERYRASERLVFYMMNNRAWYKEADVQEFMKKHFDENKKRKRIYKSDSTT